AIGPIECCDREFQSPIVKWDNMLQVGLTPAALADDDGAVVILQTSRDDLAGSGALAIDETYHRRVWESRPGLTCYFLFLVPLVERRDKPLLDIQFGDLDSAVEQTAWVAA